MGCFVCGGPGPASCSLMLILRMVNIFATHLVFSGRCGCLDVLSRNDDGTLPLSVPSAWAGRDCGRRRTGEYEGKRSYIFLSISMPFFPLFLCNVSSACSCNSRYEVLTTDPVAACPSFRFRRKVITKVPHQGNPSDYKKGSSLFAMGIQAGPSETGLKQVRKQVRKQYPEVSCTRGYHERQRVS